MLHPRRLYPGRRVVVLVMLCVMGMTFLAPSLVACPACFGETDAKTTEGITSAIYLMVAVTGGVVGGIVAFFINFRRRAAALMGQINRPPAVH